MIETIPARLVVEGIGLPPVWWCPTFDGFMPAAEWHHEREATREPSFEGEPLAVSLDDPQTTAGLLRQLAVWCGAKDMDSWEIPAWSRWRDSGDWKVWAALEVGWLSVRFHHKHDPVFNEPRFDGWVVPSLADGPGRQYGLDDLRAGPEALRRVLSWVGMDHAIRRALGWEVERGTLALLHPSPITEGWWTFRMADSVRMTHAFGPSNVPALANITDPTEALAAIYAEVCA